MNGSNILLEIDFQLRSEKRREFNSSVETLLCQMGSSFVRASAFEDRDDRNHLLLVIEWKDRTAIEAYLDSEPYRALIGCLKTLGEISDCRIVHLPREARPSGKRQVVRWEGGSETRLPETEKGL